jgi:NAD(P)-dependent dehydrogenase (short-subunit alcohol dehydrogenase family)
MKLEGKVAIVSGGGAGIGQGIVRCLAEEGADVAIVDINIDTARKVADEVEELGRKSLAIEADLTNRKKVTQAVQDVVNTFGKVDILVNNVGGLSKTYLVRNSIAFVDQEDAEWDEHFELNVRTHVLMSRAVAPYFIKQKSGKIVNISSVSGKVQMPMNMGYGAAKAADISFTKSLAAELAKYNINVNCVCPGIVYTQFHEGEGSQFVRLRPEARGLTSREYFEKFVVSRMPFKRAQTPEDIGHAVAFLVSEDAKNISGQTLSVDGGAAML